MSLKTFHIVFITVSTLMAFAFGGWALRAEDVAGSTLMGALSFLLGVVLIVYGFWFWRKITAQEEERRRQNIKPLVVAALLWTLGSRAAEACSVCYGEAEGPMIDAARAGVWLLFGLIGAMQVAFVLFFVFLWRRSRNAVDPACFAEESFEP